MSYKYRVSGGNPEGTDYTLNLKHEKQFAQNEFVDIVEACYVQMCKEESVEDGDTPSPAFVCSINSERLFELLSKQGFEPDDLPTASYYIEPYWGKTNIKNEELRKLLKAEE